MQMQVMVIGAHIDDCEVLAGGISALYVNEGHKVTFVAVTTGEMGHHIMSREKTAARRKKEGLAAAKVLGIHYEFLNLPECEITPTVEYRNIFVSIIRKYNPDLIITHPLIDYHPDHRCTAELALDASFILKVPKVVPEIPPMRKDVCFLFAVNRQAYMDELKPVFCIPIDSVWDKKITALHQHESQMYEWLPWVEGMQKKVPENNHDRLEFISAWRGQTYIDVANRYRCLLTENYGNSGTMAKYAEVFFKAPFGQQTTQEELKSFLPSIKS